MPQFRSKFQTFLSLIFFVIFLSSCDKGCVEAYQFDQETLYVDSKPTNDGISGGYTSGQTALWHDSQLATDGSQMVLEISGAWTAWDEASSASELSKLKECRMCAKKDGVENCICGKNADGTDEISKSELDPVSGRKLSNDCSNPESSDQEKPNLCTCTAAHGTIRDDGVYYIATDYQDKNEVPFALSDQQNPCRYTRGFGLYVGLFGKDGHTTPNRVYQIYPTREICDINRNSSGMCIDDSGNDVTKYFYTSPNNKAFLKDIGDGNPIYHKAGEIVKFIINDRYYEDNYGGYNINLIGGFLRPADQGLLEYIVGTVEDSLLGKLSVDGKSRAGGAIEFIYNSIVKDSTFIRIVQMLLIIYIVIFGIWVVSGMLKINKKELVTRISKIALVIFFTTESSWYFYNQLVVGFFKDGMDALIAILMTASDSAIDTTSLIITSQLERANSFSYATRFSYIDLVIKKLLSSASSKKIISLLLGEGLGFVYVPMIYALIFGFVYVMLRAALVYVQILLGLVFVLCLGPLFMLTVLFSETGSIFKKWLSYLASQSMQIICLFLVIYLFVILIDKNFTDLLSYRACTKNIDIGLWNIDILMSLATDHSVLGWFSKFIRIGALLFLLHTIMEKIPGFAGGLVSINSQPSTGGSGNAFSLANSALAGAKEAASSAINKAKAVGSFVGSPIASQIARLPGISHIGDGISAIRSSSAFNSVARRLSWAGGNRLRQTEDLLIEKAMKTHSVAKDADAKSKQKAEAAIRREVLAEGRAAGVSTEKLLKRLNDKLVVEPLQKYVVEAINSIKQDRGDKVPLGEKAMGEAVRQKVEEWAKANSSVDSSQFSDLLNTNSFKSLIRQEGALTDSQAAKIFAGSQDGKNRYLDHLQQQQVIRKREKQQAENSGIMAKVKNKAERIYGNIAGGNAENPRNARRRFMFNVEREVSAADREGGGVINKISSFGNRTFKQGNFNRLLNRKSLNQKVRKEKKDQLKKYLKDGEGIKKELKEIGEKAKQRENIAQEQYKKDLQNFSKDVAKISLDEAQKSNEFQKQQDLKEAKENLLAVKAMAEKMLEKEEKRAGEILEAGNRKEVKYEALKEVDNKGEYEVLEQENEELKEMIDNLNEVFDKLVNSPPEQADVKDAAVDSPAAPDALGPDQSAAAVAPDPASAGGDAAATPASVAAPAAPSSAQAEADVKESGGKAVEVARPAPDTDLHKKSFKDAEVDDGAPPKDDLKAKKSASDLEDPKEPKDDKDKKSKDEKEKEVAPSDKDSLVRKKAGIEQEINALEVQLNRLNSGDANRDGIQKKILSLKTQSAAINAQIASS